MFTRPQLNWRAVAGFSLAFLAVGSLLADNAQNGSPATETRSPCWNERLAALDSRLMGYTPTCAELRQRGVPIVRQIGADLVLVVPNPAENEYHVFGIGYATGHSKGPPEITWHGAELSDAINQACSRDDAR